MTDQTEQTLKELKEKVDSINLKVDAIIKHFDIKIKKYKPIGLPAKTIIG